MNPFLRSALLLATATCTTFACGGGVEPTTTTTTSTPPTATATAPEPAPRPGPASPARGVASSSSLSVAGYDRSCKVDTDCAAVYEGPVCPSLYGCGCPNAAIARGVEKSYEAALASALSDCPPPPGQRCNCPMSAVHCGGGTCAFGVR